MIGLPTRNMMLTNPIKRRIQHKNVMNTANAYSFPFFCFIKNQLLFYISSILSLIFEMEEELSQLIFTDLSGRSSAVVSQLSHGAEVSVMCALAHPGQMQIIRHPLVQFAVEVRGLRHCVLLVVGVKKRNNKAACPMRWQPSPRSAKL